MTIAVIGGTGLGHLGAGVHDPIFLSDAPIETPYGKASSTIQEYELGGSKCLFLARHGQPHKIPPHKINYRANMNALKEAGVT